MRVLPRFVALCVVAGGLAVQAATLAGADETNWEVKKPDDTTQNGPACVLRPKQPSRIQVTASRLELTGLPKNSILNYQYIVDEAPASRAIFPTSEMQNAGVIWLDDDVFRKIIDGRRLQIRILDRWHEAITEDVSLSGLRGLHKRFNEFCK